jgi:hypothetical protein
MNEPIYLFYEEPDSDRWVKFDRYPRKLIRELLRGEMKPGGVMRWYLNLRRGLDLLGVDYRINDYRGLKRNPNAWACVVGKPHVIEQIPTGNPIMYGPGIAAHPYESNFWGEANIQLMLISCEWFQQMYERDLPTPVPTAVWPAGIETDIWSPLPEKSLTSNKILLYDKVRWKRKEYENSLINPIVSHVEDMGFEIEYLRYGFYEEDNYRELLQQVRGMIFLCEHETQGFAYLQALSSDVPIIAWERAGYWQDPSMFPHLVEFEPVTSVPYFDNSCGEKFFDIEEFSRKFYLFLEKISANSYHPRQYITKNFALEKRAKDYVNLLEKAKSSLK